jgi:hypothetical protein
VKEKVGKRRRKEGKLRLSRMKSVAQEEEERVQICGKEERLETEGGGEGIGGGMCQDVDDWAMGSYRSAAGKKGAKDETNPRLP